MLGGAPARLTLADVRRLGWQGPVPQQSGRPSASRPPGPAQGHPSANGQARTNRRSK